MLTLIFKLKTYNGGLTPRDVLSTTRTVKLLGKKEFVLAALDTEYNAFIV